MGQKRSPRIEFSSDHKAQPPLNLLRHNLRQQRLLGEILRADYDLGRRRAGGQQQRAQAGDNFRSIHSSPSSASTAIAAAGSAPANTVGVSTIEIPRKMKTPNPPPPMAAAMVAVPTVATVARRSPATMDGAASGNSTCHRICRAVIPIATADARTA